MSVIFKDTVTVKQDNKEYINDLVNCQIIVKENTSETVLYPFCIILITEELVITKDSLGNVCNSQVKPCIVDLFRDAKSKPKRKQSKSKKSKKNDKKED